MAVACGYRNSSELEQKLRKAYNTTPADKGDQKATRLAMIMLDLDNGGSEFLPTKSARMRQNVAVRQTAIWRPERALRRGIGLLVCRMMELDQITSSH